jgi:hypothetical protein
LIAQPATPCALVFEGVSLFSPLGGWRRSIPAPPVHVEASPSQRRLLHSEDPRALGRLERPYGAADGRHGRHVTPTDGPGARQLKGRDRGGLHHDHVARRRRFFATWAPRQCCATPTTAAARRSWSQHHRTHGRYCCRCGSCRLEEAGVAAIAAPRVSWKRLCRGKAARACSILRPSAPSWRGHRQWSWDDSDAPGEQSNRAVRIVQGSRCCRSFL